MSKAFSVIVPTYNRADFLVSTLNSILQQTLAPIEIIVVDDGSTDNTVTVVEGYGAKVRLIQRTNSGPAAARHAGVLASTCQFIAFCDSDDLWRPNHLLKLADALDEEAAPFAFSNFSEIRNDLWDALDKFSKAPAGYWQFSDNYKRENVAILDFYLYPCLLEFQPIFPSCTAMSRRFYDQVGGYKPEFGFIPSEDLEFVLRCVCQSKVGIVFEPTVGIRKHRGNLSANVARQLNGEIQILEYSRGHHPINPIWNEAIRRQIIIRSITGFDSAFAASEIGLARQFLQKIPPHYRSAKFHIKKMITSLPDNLAIKLSNKLAG